MNLHSQQGSCLLVACLMLGLLGMLVMSSMDAALMQQRMNRHFQLRQQAFLQADSTLQLFTQQLLDRTWGAVTPGCGMQQGWYTVSCPAMIHDAGFWLNRAGVLQGLPAEGGLAASQAVIETQPDGVDGRLQYYRITSRSSALQGQAVVMLQAVVLLCLPAEGALVLPDVCSGSARRAWVVLQ